MGKLSSNTTPRSKAISKAKAFLNALPEQLYQQSEVNKAIEEICIKFQQEI